jgi:hypothetical protein
MTGGEGGADSAAGTTSSVKDSTAGSTHAPATGTAPSGNPSLQDAGGQDADTGSQSSLGGNSENVSLGQPNRSGGRDLGDSGTPAHDTPPNGLPGQGSETDGDR